jgi:hypothetical protein
MQVYYKGIGFERSLKGTDSNVIDCKLRSYCSKDFKQLDFGQKKSTYLQKNGFMLLERAKNCLGGQAFARRT